MKIGFRRKLLYLAILAGLGLAGAGAGALVLAKLGVVNLARARSAAMGAFRRPAPGSPCLLVLGDSFLSWWPVQHCLRNDIEEFCEARGAGHDNMAFGGAGPYEYLDQFRRALEHSHPTQILLFYYVGNDLTDVQYRPNSAPRRPSGPSGMIAPASGEPRRASAWLRFESEARADAPAAKGFDWDAMARHGIGADLIAKAKNRVAHPSEIGPDYVNPYLLQLSLGSPNYIIDNITMAGPKCKEAWERARATLREIARLADSVDAELCIVAIPSTVQLDRSHYAFYRKAAFRVPEDLIDSREPQKRLAKFCAGEKIRFYDLLPRFRAAPSTEALYWENDDHLSETGHELAFAMVRDEFLIPWIEGRLAPVK